MEKRFPRLRRAAGWGTAAFMGVQAGAIAALLVGDSLRRRNRSPYRFPTTPPTPTPAGEDELTVYTAGTDLYEAMLREIRNAESTIYFETYIWKSDSVGRKFKQALIDAADRGVQVYVAYDEFANLVVPRKFFQLPDNIRVHRHPAVPIVWSPRSWGRDHRKLCIVDDKVAFIGGYNIGATYADQWRDTHTKLTGPSVLELANAFVDFWNMHRQPTQPQIDSPRHRPWNVLTKVHRNVPRLQVYPIRNMYLEAIDRAAERIWLTHAYLIPDEDLVTALTEAVRRGVDVRIIVPAESNHVVADWLARGYYSKWLRTGVRLFLYQGAMVHSKTATIDGTWSTIGTANMDRLSLWGNYEINLEVTDPNVAQQMENIFNVDLSNCVELLPETWEKRSAIAKATELILAPWRPVF